MLTIIINTIASKLFDSGLYIIRDTKDDVLYWKADGGIVYQGVDNATTTTTGGGTEVEIWVLGGSSTRPLIRAVFPHWRLVIDGVEAERLQHHARPLGQPVVHYESRSTLKSETGASRPYRCADGLQNTPITELSEAVRSTTG
jgi:hypothetical protein